MTAKSIIPRRNFTSGMMINLARQGLLSKNLVSHIQRDPFLAYMYARYILKRPWPEAEPMILHHGGSAFWYAVYVLNLDEAGEQRWKDGKAARKWEAEHSTPF
jgi:hypothetical protein